MHLSKKPFIVLGTTLWIAATLFALLPSWPHLYYRLFPKASGTLASTIASTIPQDPKSTRDTPLTTPEVKENPLPDVDPALPKENGLIIDTIGVRGVIHEGTDWEKTLRQGIWRVPDFGTPEDTTYPMIIAAHRWGYLEWSAAFRKLNSFYSLPKLKVGDIIKVVWNQRPFEYKVYSTGIGTKIAEYKANLILYTCQMWNSPERYFVYANRTN